MKTILRSTLLLAAALLASCAITPAVPVDPELASMTHEFISDKDDRAAREGANPTYVALERDPQGKYRVIAVSNRFMPLKRRNQEELFFTRGFANVVPAWQDWRAEQVKEDPKTGRRTDYVFREGISDRKERYAPSSLSRFTTTVGRQAMPTLAGGYGVQVYLQMRLPEIQKAITESNALAAARAYAAGSRTYPATIADVEPLKLDAVFLVTPRGRGEVARYYFVPTSARTLFDEPVDTGSTMHYAMTEGIASNKDVPFAEMKRFKPYRFSAPKGSSENFGCTRAIMDVGTAVNLDERFCGYNAGAERWSQPLFARSPSLGFVNVYSFTGSAYRLDGSNVKGLSSLQFTTEAFDEFRLLSPAEATKARASFKT